MPIVGFFLQYHTTHRIEEIKHTLPTLIATTSSATVPRFTVGNGFDIERIPQAVFAAKSGQPTLAAHSGSSLEDKFTHTNSCASFVVLFLSFLAQTNQQVTSLSKSS
jgi:hypothetical protein